MIRSEFEVQYLKADGEPEGEAFQASYPEARTALELRWPRQCGMAQLRHCFALARSAPQHPVDAVAIHDGRVLFSARIKHLGVFQ